jgi:hypothetical protein
MQVEMVDADVAGGGWVLMLMLYAGGGWVVDADVVCRWRWLMLMLQVEAGC